MPRTYAPRSFLRHTSNQLLQRYFDDRDLGAKLSLVDLPETSVDPIIEAMQDLPPDQHSVIDGEFRRIDALATEGGAATLLDEARHQQHDVATRLAELDGHHDRAMLVFLEAPEVFEVAALFADADGRPVRYWRRRKGVPNVTVEPTSPTLTALGEAVSEYLMKSQGRGRACIVEGYARREAVFFFSYPEDYGVTHMEYGEARHLERRKLRPAFEIIFVYSADQRTLDVFVEGRRQTATDLQEVFGRAVLQRDLGVVSSQDKVYDLNRLKRRDFRFVYRPESGISDVRIKLLRFTEIGSPKARVTLEVDPDAPAGAIYDAIALHFQTASNSSTDPRTPLSLMHVTQAGFVVAFHQATRRRGRGTRTFNLTYPNGCPLGHEGKDAVIRQMLIDSDIEPRFNELARSA